MLWRHWRPMPRRERGVPRAVLQGVVAVMIGLAAAGCTYKPGYLKGDTTDLPNRWKVETIEPARLSQDQRDTLERRGPPTYVRFFREVDSRKPVYAWIYTDDEEAVELVWFIDGAQVQEIAVDRDSSAFTSTTRRRTRIALLVGTGVAIVPAIFLFAND
jgi:hypothetical protein